MQRLSISIFLTTFFFLISGCGQGESPIAEDAGEPRPGGQVIIAVQADARSLDPHVVTDAGSMRMIENLYSRLMRYTPDYPEVEPDLLASYEVSGDGTAYMMQLRQGVTFHSGRPLTAQDVKYSIERIIEKGARAEHFAAVESIEIQDDHNFIIHLDRPAAPLLTNLAYPMNAIVDRRAIEEDGVNIENAAAGSGPFRFVEWRRDQHLIMDRNGDYYIEDRPWLDRVIYRPIPDETARTTALRNREIDIILDVPEKDIALIEPLRHITVEAVPGTFWEYIGLNTQRPPFDDVRVRQAVAHALDRSAIAAMVKEGRAEPLTGGHIPPWHWAHAGLTLYEQPNPDRARELLAQAGHPDGLQSTMYVNSDQEYQRDAAMIVQQQLRQVGIDLSIQVQEPGIFFSNLGDRQFDSTIVGWTTFVDPDEWMYNLFHSEGPYNQQGYSNEQLDELLEQGRTTLDRDERQRIYAEAQRIVAEEAPMVFLYVNQQISAYLTDVGGFVVHPTGTTTWLRETWVNR